MGVVGRRTCERQDAEPITIEKLQRARARVIRIRRSDDAEAAETTPAQVPAPLSAEAEAALEAELAAVRGETPAETAAPKAKDQPRLPPAGEDAVARLLTEAESQMDVPDARRRLSAIAHLKAAVAATLADRKASDSRGASVEKDRQTAYRDDLAKVVGPEIKAPAAPAADRPAPLVLVSEQRIDRPRVPATQPTPMPTLVTRGTGTAPQARPRSCSSRTAPACCASTASTRATDLT